jgi:MFS family permease
MTETSGRYDRRNFLLNVAEGAIYVAGSSFISSQTVLPALLTRLGGGNVAVGMLGVVVPVGLFLPQIFAARITQTLPWKKPWAVWVGLAQRMVILAIGLIILTLGTSPLTLTLFLLLFGLNQILMGVATPGWFDMYMKLTPLEKRGRATGWRNAFAGLGSFVCGSALTWLLAAYGFPVNYGIAFLAAFGFQIISIFLQTRLVEELPSKTVPRQPVGEYLSELPGVFRENHGFRSFIIASVFLTLATMPLVFFTVYGLRRFQAPESVVGEFTLAMITGQVFGAVITGYVADRYGNVRGLLCASSALLLGSLWALLAPTLFLFEFVFVLVGINLGSELMLRYNLAVEFGPVERRSTYVGLMNTALAPFYLAGLLGGWMSDLLGYHALFGIGATCSLIGIALLLTTVNDPRGTVSREGRSRSRSFRRMSGTGSL